MMNYMDIRPYDTKNGIGVRVSLFVSGCDVSPHCKGCFNSEAWNFNAGKLFTQDTKDKILNYMDNPHISGCSILGGDPISNVRRDEDNTLIDLVQSIKCLFPEKTIFVWTGFKFEDIIKEPKIKTFLYCVDMLRDGPYIEKKRNLMQYLEGSTNQRYIDVQYALKTGIIRKYDFTRKE